MCGWERGCVQAGVCMCVYIWKASAYEIENRGTSGNIASEYIKSKGIFFKYSKMYMLKLDTSGVWAVRLKFQTEGVCISWKTLFCTVHLDKAGEKEVKKNLKNESLPL